MFLRNLNYRRGAALLEATLALPLLVLITLAAVQFGQAVVVEQAIGAAADEAAREAAKAANPQEMQTLVNQMLASVSLVADTGSGVRVDVQYAVGIEYHFGDDSLGTPDAPMFSQGPANSPDVNEVRVTIRANFKYTKVPDMLGYFGLSFQNRRCESSALARFQ
mgnify:CR=1 FL=1